MPPTTRPRLNEVLSARLDPRAATALTALTELYGTRTNAARAAIKALHMLTQPGFRIVRTMPDGSEIDVRLVH